MEARSPTPADALPPQRLLPPQGWRGLARLALEGLATGLFVSVVLALAVFIAATHAQAGPPAPPAVADTFVQRPTPNRPTSTRAVPSAAGEVRNRDAMTRDAGQSGFEPAPFAPALVLGAAVVLVTGVIRSRRARRRGGGHVPPAGDAFAATHLSGDPTARALSRRVDVARCVC